MANNYTESTLEPSNLTLSLPLVRALKAHGASTEGGSEDNALDQLARGDRNRHNVYVFFENGWADYEDGYSDELPMTGLSDEEQVEVKRLAKLDAPDLFREILLLNPKVEAVELHESFRCDKMRPGEFGGQALYVTRTHFLYVGDHSAKVNKDGSIKVTAKAQKFRAAKPKKVRA
jgi:hypothetical protein